MRRPRLIALIVLGVVVFFLISTVLARVLSVDGAERDAVTSLIQAEAAGDRSGMLARIQDCASLPSCRSRVALYAAELKRPGPVSILELDASAGFSLTSTLGTARVAWKVPSSLPIVQCVRVRRAGDAISGIHIELLKLSARISSDADCPKRF